MHCGSSGPELRSRRSRQERRPPPLRKSKSTRRKFEIQPGRSTCSPALCNRQGRESSEGTKIARVCLGRSSPLGAESVAQPCSGLRAHACIHACSSVKARQRTCHSRRRGTGSSAQSGTGAAGEGGGSRLLIFHQSQSHQTPVGSLNCSASNHPSRSEPKSYRYARIGLYKHQLSVLAPSIPTTVPPCSAPARLPVTHALRDPRPATPAPTLDQSVKPVVPAVAVCDRSSGLGRFRSWLLARSK